MDSNELQFILKMRDEASAVIAQHGAALNSAAGGAKNLTAAGKETSEALMSIGVQAKDAAEALVGLWASNELAKSAVEAYEEVERSLLKIQRASGATREQVEDLQNSIANIGIKNGNASIESLDKLAVTAAKLGGTREQILQFSEAVANLSAGGNTEMIGKGIADILANTNEGAEGATKLADAIAGLEEHSKATAEEIVSMTARLVQMTGGMKMSSEHAAALATSMANLGGGRAAYRNIAAVTTIMKDMGTAIEEGGAKSIMLGIAMNKTGAELKQAWKQPEQVLVSVLEKINALNKAGADPNSFMKQLGVGGLQAQSLLNLAGQVDKIKNNLTVSDNSDGAALKRAKDLITQLDVSMNSLENTWAEVKRQFGYGITPALIDGFNALKNALIVVNDVMGQMQPSEREFVAWTVVLLPAIGVLTKAITVFKEVITGFGALFAAEGATTVAAAEATAAGVKAAATGAAVTGGVGAAAAATSGGAALVAERRAAMGAAVKTEVAEAAGLGLMAALKGFVGGVLKGALLAEGAKMAGSAIGSGLNEFAPNFANNIAEGRDKLQSFLPKGINDWLWERENHAPARDEHGNFPSVEDQKASLAKAEEAANPKPAATPDTGVQDDTKAPAELVKALTKVKDAQKQIKDLAEATAFIDQEHIRALTQGDEDQLARAKQLMAARMEAADPVLKEIKSLSEAKDKAAAVTKEAKNQLEIRDAIRKLEESGAVATGATGAAQRLEVENALRNKQAVELKNTFDEELRTLGNQLATTTALTTADKDRVEIAQKLAELQRTKGLSNDQIDVMRALMEAQKSISHDIAQEDHLNPQGKALREYAEQAAELKKRLDEGQISAAKFNSEMRVLDAETLAARDPFGAMVKSQRDEIASLSITGDFMEADRKTQEEINKLLDKGLEVTKETAAAMQQYNRDLSEAKKAQSSGFEGWANKVGDIKDQMRTLESDFASGLSTAITGALQGKKGAFIAFEEQLGGQMIKMAVDGMLKEVIKGTGLEDLFGLGSKGALADAAKQTDKLAGTAAGQVAGASADASKFANQMSVATAQINAQIVNLQGMTANPAAGAQVPSTTPMPGVPASAPITSSSLPPLPANQNTPADVNIAAVSGQTITSSALPTIPAGANDNIAAGTAAMAGAGGLVAANGGTFGLGGANYPATNLLAGGVPSFGPSDLVQQGSEAVGFGGIGLGLRKAAGFGPHVAQPPAPPPVPAIPDVAAIPASQIGAMGMPLPIPGATPGSIANKDEIISAIKTAAEAKAPFADMSASTQRALGTLDPNMQKIIAQAHLDHPEMKWSMNSIQARRTPEQEKGLVDAGLSKTMKSEHLTGRAADFNMLDANGALIKRGDDPAFAKWNDAMQQASKETGTPVQWGGAWKGWKDPDHWQLPKDFKGASVDAMPTSSIGAGTTKQIDDASKQLQTSLTKLKDGIKVPAETIPTDLGKVSDSFGSGTGAGGLTNILQTGSDSVNSGITALSGTLNNGSQGVMQGVNSLVSALSSASTSSTASSVGGLFGGMHAGGVVGAAGMYSTLHRVSPAIFASARRLHAGLTSDEFPAVLQRGERVLTANDNARVTNVLSAVGAGRGGSGASPSEHARPVSVTNNFHGLRDMSGRMNSSDQINTRMATSVRRASRNM